MMFKLYFKVAFQFSLVVLLIMLNQVCSSFEESKSFEFDGRLDVLAVA